MHSTRMQEANERLSKAFRKLLRTTDYDGIDISMITAEAGMSRKNFYYHYKSKEDLFSSIVEKSMLKLESEMHRYQSWDAIVTLLRYLHADREFFMDALSLSLLNDISILLEQPLQQVFNQPKINKSTKLAADMMTVEIRKWLRRNTPGPLEFLIDFKTNLLEFNRFCLSNFTSSRY